jgi:hypothetical protein
MRAVSALRAESPSFDPSTRLRAGKLWMKGWDVFLIPWTRSRTGSSVTPTANREAEAESNDGDVRLEDLDVGVFAEVKQLGRRIRHLCGR